MRYLKLFQISGVSAALALGLTACQTHVPNEQLFPTSYQPKANAVEHWRQMSRQLCDALLTNQVSVQGKAVYVQCLGKPGADFNTAFPKLLMAELLGRNCTVVEQPELAQAFITVEPQLVQHGQRDFFFNSGTVFGAVGYSVLEFFTGSPNNDWGTSDAATSQDLLITTFVREGGKLVSGTVQIVYIPRGDYHLYGGKAELGAQGDEWAEAEARASQALRP